MAKTEADGEITWALELLKQYREFMDHFPADENQEVVAEYRRLETLIRRLAREAGYDLSKLNN